MPRPTKSKSVDPFAGQTLLLVSEVPSFLKRRYPQASPVLLSDVYRWMKRGVAEQRLEVQYLAGKLYTTEEALYRFQAAVTAARKATA